MTAFKLQRTALAAAAAALAALAALCLPTASHAAVAAGRTFDFYATCEDCVLNSAPGAPIASLTLDFDYTVGSALTLADIVAFTYVGSNLVYPMSVSGSSGSIYEVSGAIDGTPGFKDFRISYGDGQAFATTTAGEWFVCAIGPGGYYSGTCNLAQNLDRGLSGSWNQPVPEPSTYGLMALGLAGLALVRRRQA